MIKSRKSVFLPLLALSWVCVSQVVAETSSFSVGIRFVAPITISGSSNPSFGDLEAGGAGRNFVLETDGTISGTDADAYTGGAQAGSLKIQGSANQNINIVAQNFVDDGGVHIAGVTCNYGGSGNVDCAAGISDGNAPTGAGTTLLLGLSVNTTTAHGDGDTASPEFDVVVTYN